MAKAKQDPNLCPVCGSILAKKYSPWQSYPISDFEKCVHGCQLYCVTKSEFINNDRVEWRLGLVSLKHDRGAWVANFRTAPGYKKALAEARILYASDEAMSFVRAIKAAHTDDAPGAVFLDWLEERDLCPLTRKAIRTHLESRKESSPK